VADVQANNLVFGDIRAVHESQVEKAFENRGGPGMARPEPYMDVLAGVFSKALSTWLQPPNPTGWGTSHQVTPKPSGHPQPNKQGNKKSGPPRSRFLLTTER
jgi:hypothetical protein